MFIYDEKAALTNCVMVYRSNGGLLPSPRNEIDIDRCAIIPLEYLTDDFLEQLVSRKRAIYRMLYIDSDER